MIGAVEAVLAGWLEVEPERLAQLLTPQERDRAARLLELRVPSPQARSLRRLSTPILLLLGERGHIGLGNLVKRLRSRGAPPLPDLAELWFPRLVQRLRGQFDSPQRAPRVALTHDVDWRACWEFLPRLVEEEKTRGLRSTLNLLTEWRYRPDPGRVREWDEAGFEIGLHGATHDAGIGYRSRGAIRSHLQRAIAALPVRPSGYRAPALAVSKLLLEVLVELGFHYDSSVPVASRYYHGVEAIWPYRIPGLPLWELPLALQDDTLLRDMGLEDDEAATVVEQALNAVLAQGGTFVLNLHPGLVAEHPRFLARVLDMLAASAAPVGPARNALPEEQEAAH